MKKILGLILIMCSLICVLGLTGCGSQDVNLDEVRIAVYNTRYDGKIQKNYPDYILSSGKVLDMIDAGTGTEPIKDVEQVVVLHKLVYTNSNNEEISVLIQSNGEITYMSLGLPRNVYYLTNQELHNVLLEIVGTNK